MPTQHNDNPNTPVGSQPTNTPSAPAHLFFHSSFCIQTHFPYPPSGSRSPVPGRTVLCDSRAACQSTAEARLNPPNRQRLGEQTQFVLICCLLTFLVMNTEILAPRGAQSLLGELLIPSPHCHAVILTVPLTSGKHFCCVLWRACRLISCSAALLGTRVLPKHLGTPMDKLHAGQDSPRQLRFREFAQSSHNTIPGLLLIPQAPHCLPSRLRTVCARMLTEALGKMQGPAASE